MNETASFIDACVVVRLCHQSGIPRRSFTVRNVRGTSSHRNYQTDLQHLHLLVNKTSSSNLSTTRSPFLIHELTMIHWHYPVVVGRLNVNLVKLLTGDGATRFDLT